MCNEKNIVMFQFKFNQCLNKHIQNKVTQKMCKEKLLFMFEFFL